MIRTLTLMALCVALLGGCVSRDVLQKSGLEDFDRRYMWLKPGADDVERRRAVIACAELGQARLEELGVMASIPGVGLLALGPILTEEREIAASRVTCMEARGWRLVDVTTNEPQRVTASGWQVRVEPAAQTAQAR